ncbi:HET domain-containing protein [Fusarium falciforme]|uniref:HET domain-containing protein n=1 Tax=Fusarium falciforme TaxID=195108 RepID=UPI002301B0FE|nr:HET domain-containing protein [Fusarium falciforme]WAO96256.1 HET domain-containing protein [Fusarium falciforme]
MVKFGGLGGLLGVGLLAILFDAVFLLLRQIEAAFGQNMRNLTPRLDYQHKPRFALAAVSQAMALAVAFIFTMKDHQWPIYILFVFPMTAVATFLGYLSHGHEPEYLNDSVSVHSLPESQGPPFCQTCRSTIFSNALTGPTHHLTADSLYRYRQDPYNLHGCQFQMRQRQVADSWIRPGMLDLRKRIALTQLPSHTGSDQSLAVAAKWLQHCTIYHEVCCSNQDRSFRPSRLLYVENDAVCLHTTRKMPKRVRYLTLSHCWGKLHILRLLESNEDSFHLDIRMQSLPKTFQDAIHITRRLGFSYLWIDSLCIIQDSKEDWLREAALMGKIYKNAACNIAAPDASSGQQGCLYPRNPRTIQPEPMNYGSENEEYLVNETDIYDDHVLYSRAWVLQEAILARRTLDCGRGQLFWRCSEMRASEVFPGGVPTNIYHDDHPASKFKAISTDNDQVMITANILERRLSSLKTRLQIPIAPGRGSLERYTEAPFAFWSAIVGEYTKMKLTKDTDRIVALAGITDVFRPFFGDHWFGMWRIFMPLELLWQAGGTGQRPSTLRAPTWSWFSVERPVYYTSCEFNYRRDRLITEFIDAEAVGENGMRLRLSTPLLRATWSSLNDFGTSCVISSLEGETRRMSFFGIPTIPDTYGDVSFDHWDDGAVTEDVFLMCIQIRRRSGSIALGLVLHEVDEGVYERLGHFSIPEDLIEPFLDRTTRREVVLM